ncbi:uncharacterized protein [Antedon mediterranea]|uniref:uncharacterized protein isoform X2 n=1 Tax=Antedon mediterranea TaxID=105859 RepID=UPI003AF807C1
MVFLKLLFLLVVAIQVKSTAVGLSEWSQWSPCFKTCGASFRVRSRSCHDDSSCASEELLAMETCYDRPSCEGPSTTKADLKRSTEVDIVFLLDESISVSKHYVTLGEVFIRRFLQKSLESYGDLIRHALCSFSSKFNIVFEYGELDETGMINALEGLRYDGGSTDVAYAIERLGKDVLTRARPEAKSVVVLISDGFFDKDPVAPPGVTTFVVAIGDNINTGILSKFTEDDGSIFDMQLESDVSTAIDGLLSAM